METKLPLTAFHWGTYRVRASGGTLQGLVGFEEDPDPSAIGSGYLGTLDGPTRITRPMFRRGWLEGGTGASRERRGEDAFVAVGWDEAADLVAHEINRVRETHGSEAIYAGSYGWASAGRFHHAQGHLRRFLNLVGGATRSVDSYSLAAGEVIIGHVLGGFYAAPTQPSEWRTIIGNTELFVAFGGLPLKNGQIAQGGTGRHRQREAMIQAHSSGTDFVNVSPMKGDMDDCLNAQWMAPRPSTDAALMIALAHTLVAEGLHDRAFLKRYTVGFDRYAKYLLGETDGIAKSADWAAQICDLPAESIRDLARRMAASRTMISASWSLTRQDHGEQPFWAAVNLAAILGQIGLPGGGVGFGYSAVNTTGLENTPLSFAAFPQGRNPVDRFIPVARIADMLEKPGQAYHYNGQTLTYPDIRLVYWAGGNPFHHHQDLNRFRKAWARPETIIVNEWCWNPLAKHADIVLPCTTPLERNDLCMGSRDPYVVAMDAVCTPPGDALDDFQIFRKIARAMGVEDRYTEGRTTEDWIRWLYEESGARAEKAGRKLPELDDLRDAGWHRNEPSSRPHIMLEAFRSNPDEYPLASESGLIELFSDRIAGFAYDDAPPHPAWLEPYEWLGADDAEGALHLISNQPATKLHSQLDHGPVSAAGKIAGREPVLMHPDDAAARGLKAADVVRVWNARGACLAAVRISPDIRRRVVQISTGAWFDPMPDGHGGVLCKHGNPNVLTRDKGTSQLAQGPSAMTCLVRIERYTGPIPPITAYDPPDIVERP